MHKSEQDRLACCKLVAGCPKLFCIEPDVFGKVLELQLVLLAVDGQCHFLWVILFRNHKACGEKIVGRGKAPCITPSWSSEKFFRCGL